MNPDDVLVVVHNAWNGWHSAFIRLCDLRDIRWLHPMGAPKPLIHADVECTSVMEGDIPHDCERTPTPHWLLVCVLKRHSTVPLYEEIVRRADHRKALLGLDSTTVS